MSGSPLLLELLARRIQEEHLEEARRERRVIQMERVSEPRGGAFLSAVRHALASAGQRLAHLRSAPSAR